MTRILKPRVSILFLSARAKLPALLNPDGTSLALLVSKLMLNSVINNAKDLEGMRLQINSNIRHFVRETLTLMNLLALFAGVKLDKSTAPANLPIE